MMINYGRAQFLGLVIVLAALLIAYLPTLQTIPNGSENYYMIDVGETQVVLNSWGTLHATGYPLYVMIGSFLVAIMRAFGVNPAAAPSLYAMFWGMIALTLIYTLALHLTRRASLAAMVTILFGLTRTMWIHNVIAEVYTMSLAILVLLLLVALWKEDIPHRIYWLALLGGIGVAHHRAMAMAIPALLYAVWPELAANRRRLPRMLLICLLLGLVGFLPYIYLPLRAHAGATWVYGEPGTWPGFWDQFFGREASRFIGPPQSLAALLDNFKLINSVLITDLTLPGIAAGAIGLLLAVRHSPFRRPALTLFLSGLTAYVFHVFLYDDILSALILAVMLSVAFGWLFLAAEIAGVAQDWAISKSMKPAAPFDVGEDEPTILVPRKQPQSAPPVRSFRLKLAGGLVALAALAFGAFLAAQNFGFIQSLTQDPTGLETIAMAGNTPIGATLMLAWGPRYFAVGFAHDVLGELSRIRLVDHKADFPALVSQGMLVTPEYSFYDQPVSWWEQKLGTHIYLRTVAPSLVQIDTQEEHGQAIGMDSSVTPVSQTLECLPDSIWLRVSWFAPQKPTEDLNVFVHMLDGNGAVIGQGDHPPVYNWQPMTTWDAGEIVRDVYALPRLPNARSVKFGLYRTLSGGGFDNASEYTLLVECEN